MKRLYQKIYLTIVVALLLVVLVAGAIWRFGQPPAPVAEGFEVAGELLVGGLAAGRRAGRRAAGRDPAARAAAQRQCRAVRCGLATDRLLRRSAAAAATRAGPAGCRARGRLGIPLPDGRWIVGARRRAAAIPRSG